MAHDVFICYDKSDEGMANKICSALEDNGLKCWLKSRDVRVNEVGEATNAISKAQIIVLVYSKNAIESNFVNNEVDVAFSQKKDFVIFNIDDSKLQGPLEFFLNNHPQIHAHPNPEEKFDQLVKITKKQRSIVKKYRIPIIVAAAIVIIAVIGAFAFTSMSGDTGTDFEISPGDVAIKITDFHVDDVRKESTSWNYSYFVGGTVSKDLSGSNKYRIVCDFYDKSGGLVDSTETVFADAQKIGDGFLFGSTVSDENNITRVEVQLLDPNDIVIAQDGSQL